MSLKRKSFYEDDEYNTSKGRSKKSKTPGRPKQTGTVSTLPSTVSVTHPARNPMFNAAQRLCINDEDMRICYDHLCELMNHLQATPFNMPVDWEGLGLPDYPQKVKTPLDLGTIKQMLINNSFANPEHFAIHVDLVFKNAQVYNPQESPLYKAACNLAKLFTERYNQLFEPVAEGENIQEDDQVEDLGYYKDTIRELNKSIAELKENIEAAKESRKKVQVRRIRLIRPNSPLSYAEKEEMCKLIPTLNGQELRGLLDIIHPPKPDGDQGEVEIDIESMDDATLVRAQRYLATCSTVKGSNTNLLRRSRSLSTSGESSSKPKGTTLVTGRAGQVKVGMLLPVSPEDNYEVQWFELRNRDCLHAFNKALTKKAGDNEPHEIREPTESTVSAAMMEIETEKKSDEVAMEPRQPEQVERTAASHSEQTKPEGEPDLTAPSTPAPLSAPLVPTFHPKVLADNDDPNVRWYEKSQIFDAIPVDTVYCGVDLMSVLEFHPDVGLWRLPNALQVMERVLQYDEMDDASKATERIEKPAEIGTVPHVVDEVEPKTRANKTVQTEHTEPALHPQKNESYLESQSIQTELAAERQPAQAAEDRQMAQPDESLVLPEFVPQEPTGDERGLGL